MPSNLVRSHKCSLTKLSRRMAARRRYGCQFHNVSSGKIHFNEVVKLVQRMSRCSPTSSFRLSALAYSQTPWSLDSCWKDDRDPFITWRRVCGDRVWCMWCSRSCPWWPFSGGGGPRFHSAIYRTGCMRMPNWWHHYHGIVSLSVHFTLVYLLYNIFDIVTWNCTLTKFEGKITANLGGATQTLLLWDIPRFHNTTTIWGFNTCIGLLAFIVFPIDARIRFLYDPLLFPDTSDCSSILYP